MQSNHLNWAKSFGSAGGYYDKINEMITCTTTKAVGQTSTNMIKHATSLPSNTPSSNFENNLYMIKSDQVSSAEGRNPLRSAILPTKV
jgi:hypothetical protein